MYLLPCVANQTDQRSMKCLLTAHRTGQTPSSTACLHALDGVGSKVNVLVHCSEDAVQDSRGRPQWLSKQTLIS